MRLVAVLYCTLKQKYNEKSTISFDIFFHITFGSK